jgi:hypothetical protein
MVGFIQEALNIFAKNIKNLAIFSSMTMNVLKCFYVERRNRLFVFCGTNIKIVVDLLDNDN